MLNGYMTEGVKPKFLVLNDSSEKGIKPVIYFATCSDVYLFDNHHCCGYFSSPI